MRLLIIFMLTLGSLYAIAAPTYTSVDDDPDNPCIPGKHPDAAHHLEDCF
ncbi:uncharacterized protein SCHCODRAFT_01201014 [Schizophyllum commune H4-8]|nr:uncharacterized protein SCHCODRAFT_01201014 [Schizophyllum commune H4-8]KAI5892408.1 hypothetical protein SCHCODRAFT_01201014 [Schizophyllum commune H4-8]